MFSAALSSGQAGGSDTMVRFFGTLSLRVVCQPAWSRMTMACAPGATARLISSRCLRIAAVLAYGMMMAAPVTLLGPLVDERVLLPNPHLILEPHLDRGCQCKSAHGLQYAGWKAFFKSRNRLRILLGMPRPGAAMRKAKLPEHTPKAHLGQINRKTRTKNPLEIDATPPRNPILLRLRDCL